MRFGKWALYLYLIDCADVVCVCALEFTLTVQKFSGFVCVCVQSHEPWGICEGYVGSSGEVHM